MGLENFFKKGKKHFSKIILPPLVSLFVLLSSCEKSLPTETRNSPPEIYSSPITSVVENEIYNYQVLARDKDGDKLTYSFVQKPPWLSISQSGVVSGTAPSVSENKTENVGITVSDGEDFSNQDYSVTTTNKEVEDFVLGENTSVFPASFIENYISSVDPNKLVFTSPVTLSVGSILVGENSPSAPDGFLRKISSLSSDKKTVYTTSATMEQGIYNGAFLNSASLSPSGIKKFIGKKGISKSSLPSDFDFSLNFDDVVLFDADGNNLTINDQITVTGNYAFTTQFGLGLNIDEGKLENLLFENTTKESSSLKMIISKNWQEPFEKEFNLAEYSFNPFVLCWIPTAPPFPVVVRPEIDIFTGVSFASTFPSEISVSQEALLKAGLEYNNNSWNLISYFSNDFGFSNPFSEGDSETKAYIGAKLSLMVYGIIGPGTTVKDNLKLDVSENSWKLSGGLEALVGINMGVFSNSIGDVNKTIFDYEKLLAEGEIREEDKLEGKIVFTAYDGSDYDLYTINADGTNKKRITSNSLWDVYPFWHPNEDKIIYSTKVPFASDNFDIYTINADGTNKQQLTFSSLDEYCASFSPDGTKIIFSGTYYIEGDIYLMNLSDSTTTIIIGNEYNNQHPFWSPDGEKFVFESTMDNEKSEIYISNLITKNITRLTKNDYDDTTPSFSPDGTKISYSSSRNGDKDIYIINLDGSGEKNITNDQTRSDGVPCWSPGGNYIVYSSSQSSMNGELWIINLTNYEKHKLVSTSSGFYNLGHPSWKR